MEFRTKLLALLLLASTVFLGGCPGNGEGDVCFDSDDCTEGFVCYAEPDDTSGFCEFPASASETCDDNGDCRDPLGDCEDASGAATPCDPQIDITDVQIDDLPGHIAITVGVAAEIIETSPVEETTWDISFLDESPSTTACTASLISLGGAEFECTLQTDAKSVLPDGQSNLCEVSADGTEWRFGFATADCDISLGTVTIASSSGSGDAVSKDSFEADLSGGGGGIPPKPTMIHPCDVFTEADIQVFSGEAMTEMRGLDNDNRRICEYWPADTTGGMRLVLEAHLNSAAADFLVAWREQRSDAIDIHPVTWSPEGEVRGDGVGASLWAFVINDDPLGRNVFIAVEALPYDGTGAPAIALLTSTLESVSETLYDAILAAQP